MTFNHFGLRPEILKNIATQGYTTPTPIQSKAIPEVLLGKDVLARAQTGTGKTAAFTLPLLQMLSSSPKPGHSHPRVLVLTPTRELAAQIGESVTAYGQGLKIRSTVVFGGVGINPQIDKLKKGVELLVATPGRLLDLVGQKHLNLSKIEVLVLDEADRMLDMGFIHDIRKIMRLLPGKRQTLFFSATYAREIQELADSILKSPAKVEVSPHKTAAETVDQAVYKVEKLQKRSLLSHLIRSENWSQVLIFTRTKHGANRLAKQLESDGVSVSAIHGNKSQTARTQALADFKANAIQALVATDIAARGLDIDGLPHVVNFELPNVPEDYVHRIGRTGRAGMSGEAVSLVSEDEDKLLLAIEKLLKRKLPVKSCDFEPRPVTTALLNSMHGQRIEASRRELSRRENLYTRSEESQNSGSRGRNRAPGKASGRSTAKAAAKAVVRNIDRPAGSRPTGRTSGKPTNGRSSGRR